MREILSLVRPEGLYRRGCPETGAVAVEAALVLPLLFFVFLGFLGLVLYLGAELSLDFAVYQGIRQGLFANSAAVVAVEEAIITGIVEQGKTWGVTIEPANIEICPVGDASCAVNSVGKQGGFFSVVVTGSFLWGTQHSVVALGAYVQ